MGHGEETGPLENNEPSGFRSVSACVPRACEFSPFGSSGEVQITPLFWGLFSSPVDAGPECLGHLFYFLHLAPDFSPKLSASPVS